MTKFVIFVELSVLAEVNNMGQVLNVFPYGKHRYAAPHRQEWSDHDALVTVAYLNNRMNIHREHRRFVDKSDTNAVAHIVEPA